MKRIAYDNSWPASWRYSYQNDQREIYGDLPSHGYTYSYLNRKNWILSTVQKIGKPNRKILDVAAAQGNFSLWLAEMGHEVTWNDLRGELSGYVELKREKGIIHYVPGNIFEMNYDSYFDIILITEIIEHVAHPDQFLEKISKMVVPGGYIVMTTPNGGYFRNPLPKFSEYHNPAIFESVQFKPDSDGHIFLLHEDEILPLAKKANLLVEKVDLFTNPLTNGHLKTRFLLRILPKSFVDWIECLTQRLPFFIRKKILIHTGALFKKAH